MKTVIIYILFIASLYSYGQEAVDEIKALEGIWVAEEYFNSFEKSNSAVVSKNSFYHSDPVALRINSKEVNNGVLSVGYSVLHDHILRPEVSEYLVRNNDTIREQGTFKIDLKIIDSLRYYKTSEIYFFNYEWVSYMTWNIRDTSIILFRPKNEKHKEKYIRYKRIEQNFSQNYQYPNPLYYYTRLKNLIGNYTLKDSLGNVLSTNFKINKKGIISGYQKFQGFTTYYSTDIYCGPSVNHDFILFCEDIFDNNSKSFGFVYKKSDNGTIALHNRRWKTVEGREESELSNMKYELIKN